MVNKTVSTRLFNSHGSNEALLPNQDGDAVHSSSARKLKAAAVEQNTGISGSSPSGERACLGHRSTSSLSTGTLLLPSSQTITRLGNSTDSSENSTGTVDNKKTDTPEPAGIDVGSMLLEKNLKAIIAGAGVCKKVVNCGLGCFYDARDTTTDQQWLLFLQRSICFVDHNAETYWSSKPESTRTLIQHILFSTFRAVQRFDYVSRYVSHVQVKAIEEDIKTILKHYYCQFGVEEFRQIFDHKTYPYTSDPVYENGHYKYPEYDYDIVSKTLAEHFRQESHKYLPDFVRRLLNAVSDSALESVLELTEAQQHRRAKNERVKLMKLFVEGSLSEQFTRVHCMQGLKNYGSTCFAAASIWPIICSPYCAFLEANSGAPQTDVALPNSAEQCLRQLRSETGQDQQVRLLQAGLAKCLTTMARQYRQEQYLSMQSTYKLLLDLCIQGATQGNFAGFEGFDALVCRRLSHQKSVLGYYTTTSATKNYQASVVHARHLSQQDCAEFFAPLLQVVLPEEQLQKCAFRVLTERKVMRLASIVTITDNPQSCTQSTEAGQSADQAQPDTFIFPLPVAPEQADRDDFSLQMLLDEVLSFQNVAHHQQRITVRQDSFKHTVQDFPLASDQEVKEQEWDILSERQVLLVNEAPKVITIQPKVPPGFRQRAVIAKRLASDQTREVSLTFRKVNADKSLPPETIEHNYRICAKVFYVEKSGTGARHYRCSINDKKWGELLIDDEDVYQPDGGQNDSTKRGILCLIVMELVGEGNSATPSSS